MKAYLLQYSIILGCIVGISSSLLELRVYRAINSAERELESLDSAVDTNRSRLPEARASRTGAVLSGSVVSGSGPFGRVRSLTAQTQQADEVTRDVAELWFGGSDAHTTRARFLRRQAFRESDSARSIALWCEALSETGAALSYAPRDARQLMNWANVRQILGAYACSQPFTEGSYARAVEEALRLNPTDVQVKYAAGLLYLWGRDVPQAYQLFHDVLEFGTSVESSRQNFIFSLVRDGDSLKRIVPATFPQVLNYSAFFQKSTLAGQSVQAREEIARVLTEHQDRAVQESMHAFEAEQVPYQLHRKRLSSLLPYVRDFRVRQRIDREMASLLDMVGQTKYASYSRERSEYRELSIVRADLAGDSRAQKSPLVRWGTTDTVYFDDFYHSIGFYLPVNQTPRLIEIVGRERTSSDINLFVRVFVSSDNEHWSEVGGEVSVEMLDQDDRSVVVIRTNAAPYRYWKLHFASSNRLHTMRNAVPDMLRVFGLSTREDSQS